MIAGRELDALVAEKVMGRRPGPEFHWNFGTHVETTGGLPQYSTSIADAWLVVEKMFELGWCFDLNLYSRYTAVFRKSYLPSRANTDSFEGKEDTAPHAICLAALKAVSAPHHPHP